MLGMLVLQGRYVAAILSRGMREVLAALMLASLLGCANPNGYLVPVAGDFGGASVRMLAATTRAPSDMEGVAFSGDRGDTVSFSNITVSLPTGREPGTVQWPRTSPGDPQSEFVVTSISPVQKADLSRWFSDTKGDRSRVFVYVHGFNTRFDRAVFRMAQLTHDSHVNAAPVLFSWPSRGQVLDYRRDLDNASYSRSDLADLLEIAVNARSVDEIVILAHSMGSWIAVEAVKLVALKNGGVSKKITNLMLASPDLDIGVFRRQVEAMGSNRPRITLFVSQADRALSVSAWLSRGATRLGSVDPEYEAYRQQLGALDGVTILDLTALRSGDPINHSAYAKSPKVVRHIGQRLIEGQAISDFDASQIDMLGQVPR